MVTLLLFLRIIGTSSDAKTPIEDAILIQANYYKTSGFPDSALMILRDGYEKLRSPVLLREIIVLEFQTSRYDATVRSAKEFLKRFYPDSLVLNLLTRSFVALEDTQSALRSSMKYLDLYPDDLGAIHLTANIFDIYGNSWNALRLYRRLFILKPDSLPFFRDYLAFLVREAIYDEALAILNKWYEKFPPDPKVELTYATLLEKLGNDSLALIHYSKSNMLRPSPNVVYRMAQILINRSKYQDVLAVIRLSKHIDPVDPEVRKLLGIVHYYLRADSLALNELLASLALKKDDPETHYYLARVLRRMGFEESAYKHAKVSYELSKNPDYGLYLAYLEIIKNQPKTAIALINELNLDERAHTHTLLGFAYRLLNDTTKALQEFEKAVKLDPLDPKRKRDLASLYLTTGRDSQAITLLEELRKSGIATREDLMNLALLHAKFKNYNDAHTIYQTLYQIDSLDPTLLNNWGYTLAEARMNLKLAKTLVSKALKIDPDNPIFLDSIGWVYFMMDSINYAYYYIKRAIDLGAKDPEILYHMGVILNKLGKNKEALNYLKRALELDPNNEKIRQEIENTKINRNNG